MGENVFLCIERLSYLCLKLTGREEIEEVQNKANYM